MKKDKSGFIILLDALALAALLIVFALFHHVLPSKKQALNIVSYQASAETQTAEPVITATAEPVITATAEPAVTATAEPAAAQTAEPAIVQTAVQAAAPAADGAKSYQADGVSITLSDNLYLNGSVRYYLADIYLDDVTKLQTAFAENTYGSGYTDTVMDMDALLDAVLCVNGDYYGNTDAGVVARNGVIYRANYTSSDILCLYADGTVEIKPYEAFDVKTEANRGLWQAWTFGPSLLDQNGQAVSAFSTGRHMNSRNPRTVFGYYGPGHYAILVVDGRGDSAGLTLADLSTLCEELGFASAYNLDGGKSSVMTYADSVVNQPVDGGRAISDFIYIKEAL